MRWQKRGAVILLLVALGGGVRAQDRPPLCLPGPNPSGHPLFGSPSLRTDFERFNGDALPTRTTHAAFGDLNGDGLLDGAFTGARQVSGLSPAYVTVCFNQGNGVFGPPALYTAGRECCAVEMADFDRDGDLDLAVANATDGTITVLYNRGDGTFGARVNYPVGLQPRSLKVGDLDGDGWRDVAVLNCVSSDVSILLNTGNGILGPQTRVAVANVTRRGDPNLAFPYPGPFLALGDFNGDRALDIAVPAGTRVKVLLNDGAGGFAGAPVNAPVTAPNAYCIAAGDLDRDGRLDLAVAVTSSGNNGLNVLRGRGDGTFDPAVAYNADPEPLFVFTNHVALGDLDGDGFLDVAVGSEYSYGKVPIFRNRGDGTFFPKEFVNSDYRSWYVGLVDLTGRGRPDLAVLAPQSRSPFKVHLNDGTGGLLSYVASYLSATPTGAPDAHVRAAAADLDGDGNLDLALTVTNHEYQVVLCRGVGAGRFEVVSTISLGPHSDTNGEGVALADLNGDQRPDLVVADPIDPGGFDRPGKVWVALNTGGFGFAAPAAYPLAGVTPTTVIAVDLNGDGRRDLAVWSTEPYPGNTTTVIERRIQVLINRGDGTFEVPVAYVIGSAPVLAVGSVAAADFDHDGDLDLAGGVTSRNWPGSIVSILRNRGDGTFEPWGTTPVGGRPDQIIAADLNGDGFADLAVEHLRGVPGEPVNDPYLTVLYNDGAGNFPTRIELADPQLETKHAMTVADFNGDGRLDVALDEVATRSVLILLNRGDGAFERPIGYGAMGYYPHGIAALIAGDFDHRGRTGILAVQSTDFVSYLPNLACPGCYANCDGSTAAPVLNARDFACFLGRFAARDPLANCDSSLTAWGAPGLDVEDFVCFMQRFAEGCAH